MISMDQFKEFLARYPLLKILTNGQASLAWYRRVECGVQLLQDQPPGGKWMTSFTFYFYAQRMAGLLNEEIPQRHGCVIIGDWENAVILALILLGYCRSYLWSSEPIIGDERYSTLNYVEDGYLFFFASVFDHQQLC
jgi:hypothetical protein